MTFKEAVGIDGPFSRIGTLIFEIIYCNMLWLLFGGPIAVVVLSYLPIVTNQVTYILNLVLTVICFLHMGPATTAAFSALGKRQRKEETYTFRDFWHSYKQNYKQGMIVSLIFTAVSGLLGYAIWLEVTNIGLYGKMMYIVLPVQGFAIIELIFIFTYIFALLARFEMSTKNLFKYAFMMANKHLPTTLLCAALLIASVAAFLFWNMLSSVFMFGLCFYFSAMLLERVFRNYMPDEDEALAEEEVENYNLDAERQAIIDRYTGKLSQQEEQPKE
ncbi:MAG: DUF624 domain-containing protein [Lachnospiraceae bacterium]|jgi:uncharacterized membrane protein YesL|nr:DUF624 domain-containing protein [Lachnospiraceae bacterium]